MRNYTITAIQLDTKKNKEENIKHLDNNRNQVPFLKNIHSDVYEIIEK